MFFSINLSVPSTPEELVPCFRTKSKQHQTLGMHARRSLLQFGADCQVVNRKEKVNFSTLPLGKTLFMLLNTHLSSISHH
jgi:hypothetical protein